MLTFLGGLATGWSLLAHLAYVLAALDLIALVLVTLGRRGLEITSSVDRTVLTAGETLEGTCLAVKRSRWPAFSVDLVWADGEGESFSIPGSGSRAVSRTISFPRRGRYLAGGAGVRVRDPFGLIEVGGGEAPGALVTVYPRPLATPAAIEAVRTLSESRRGGSRGLAEATIGELRDYVPGDALSRIHWRTTARRGTLTVSDPEHRQRSEVWLLVDLGGDEDETEQIAGIAAYLTMALQRGGLRVSAIVAGESVAVVSAPDRAGRSSPVLSVLAEMPSARFSQITAIGQAARRLGHAGTFIVISPGRESAWVELSQARPGARSRSRTLYIAPGDDA